MAQTRYNEYLQKLKTNYQPAIKIDWLNRDGSVKSEISNSYIDMSGSLSINMNSGCRRSCTITLDNTHGEFPIDITGIWYTQQIKLWMGVYLDDGSPYYFPQGVFYISSVTEENAPGKRLITLECVDKWAFLDGSLNGNLDGIYIIPIGSNIYQAIEKLLQTSLFTGGNVVELNEPIVNSIDPVQPMFSSYYLTKKYTTPDGKTHNAIETPYEVRIEYGKTYADILLELATILGAFIYYDADGRLTIEPTQDDISDASKPIMWTFTPLEQEFLSEQSQHDFTSWYNDVLVIGYVINGYQAHGRAQNQNPSSPTCIQICGFKTQQPYQDSAYYTDEQCEELALYYLKKLTIKQRNVTITSAPIYHLQENRLIECIRPYTMVKEALLISGMSIPIGTTGTMSITATSVNDLTFK